MGIFGLYGSGYVGLYDSGSSGLYISGVTVLMKFPLGQQPAQECLA